MSESLKNQYVVFRDGDTRVAWGQVDSETDTEVSGVFEKGLPYDEPRRFDVRRKDLLAILGKKPEVGSAYGQRIEPFLRTVESETWGSLHFFTKLSDEDKAKLKAGLSDVGKVLKKQGLTGILPLDIEIRIARGRYAGMYKHFGASDKRDRMQLFPKEWDNARYIIGHESGHGVWFQLMTTKQHARWISLYHAYLKVTECDPATVRSLRDDFCNQSAEHVKDFRGQLDEEVAPIFDLCIEHITGVHGINVSHIDKMIEAEEAAFVRSLWPTSKILKTDYEYPISEYAMTKPEEFFAEAFGMWVSGVKLPKRIQALLDKTLQSVAGRKSRKA